MGSEMRQVWSQFPRAIHGDCLVVNVSMIKTRWEKDEQYIWYVKSYTQLLQQIATFIVQNLIPVVNSGGEDCRSSGMGKEYAGTANVTGTGRPCQRWDKQTPHSHTRNNPSKFPDSSLEEASNYCRNRDDTAGGPWCHTIDENVCWEFCPIPICRQFCNGRLHALDLPFGSLLVTLEVLWDFVR